MLLDTGGEGGSQHCVAETVQENLKGQVPAVLQVSGGRDGMAERVA